MTIHPLVEAGYRAFFEAAGGDARLDWGSIRAALIDRRDRFYQKSFSSFVAAYEGVQEVEGRLEVLDDDDFFIDASLQY